MRRLRIAVTWIALGTLLFAVLLRTPAPQALASQAGELADVNAGIDGDLSAVPEAQDLTPRAYLPLMSNRYFIEYWYQDDFSDTGSDWPWASNPFSYGYKTDGDGSKVYHIRMGEEGDLVFITGPVYALGNFEYEAWMRRATKEIPLYWGDECGLLISPDPIDAQDPSGSAVYTFQVELKIGDDVDSLYSIVEWNALRRSKRDVLTRVSESEYITDVRKFWNRFKITRTGDTLRFYLTRQEGDAWKAWQHVYTCQDPTLPDQLYIGFYAYHSKDDFGDYEIEFQFDNVNLHAYP
jgi:hypothetical protein